MRAEVWKEQGLTRTIDGDFQESGIEATLLILDHLNEEIPELTHSKTRLVQRVRKELGKQRIEIGIQEPQRLEQQE